MSTRQAVLTSLTLSLLVLSACSAGGSKEMQLLRADINDLRELQAQHTAQLNELRSEMSSLSGKVEELQFRVTGKTAELEKSLVQLGSRVPPPAGIPEDLLAADEESISKVQSPEAQKYLQGLRLIRQGSFQEAEQIFGNFVAANPNTAFTDNALYWMGMCLERLGQYDRAVVSYSDVFRRFPAEDRVPQSLLRLGEAFASMGSTNDAVITFQKLIDEHPRTREALTAKERVASLRRGKR